MRTVDIRVLLADDVDPDDVTQGIVAGSLDETTTALAATVLVKDEWWESVAAYSGAPSHMVPSTIYTRDATVWDGEESW